MTTAQLQSRLPAVVKLHTADSGKLCRYPGRALGHLLNWITDTRPDGPATIVAAPQPGDEAHRAALWMQIDALVTWPPATLRWCASIPMIPQLRRGTPSAFQPA